MDPHTVLIGIAVFCLSALLIYLISIFGIKEKTFEEALAEQKQRLEDEKQKEKSLKKAEKEKKKFRKSKEKPKEKGLQVSEPELPKEQKMVNLEIDPEIIEPLTDTSSTEGKRSQNTKKKPKSILHNKNEEPHVTKETQQVVHHIPVPKDELEILHDHEKDQKDVKKDKSAPKASKKGKEEVKSTPKRPIVMEEEIIVPKYENVSHTASYSSPDSKMRIDPSQLVANIHTAPLTDSEIQNLIEVLLNKQGGASSSWNKKTQKGDDVKLLRKQLEEKERALQEEQKLAMQANACLSKEKAGYNTLEKQYQEKIAVQNSEIQALRSKMQHSIEQHMLERSSLQTRLQQLERQAGDQSLAQKLSEENKILKENLKRAESETVPQKNYASLTRELQIIQEELSKNVSRNTAAENAKKTLEEKLAKKDAELAKLKGSEKESEGVVTKRLDEVNKQLRKTEAENATLTNNLKTAERECSTVKARLQELEMALSGNDNTSKVLEEKLQETCLSVRGAEKAKSNVEASLKATEKKLVDAEQQKAKLEKEFEDAKKQKSEVEANLKSTEQKLTDMEQLQTKLQTDFESAEKVKSDMQSNLENLEQKLSETEQNKDKLQNEMEVLKQENSSLSQEMVVVKETVVKTAGAPNGDIHDEPAENKIAISQHEKIVSEKETEIKRLVADMEAKVSELSKLQGEVDKQKKKNNDLRQKNWEAMEALQKAEKSVTLQVQSAVKDTKNDESTALVTDAEKYDKTVLQKIFPDISVNTNLVHKEWMSCFEKEAIVQLQSLSSANESIAKSETKVTDLQGQVSSLETQVQELKSSLSSSCASYEAKVKALEEKNSSLHSEVDKLHSESSNVSSSDSRVTELEESNTKLETQVQEYLNVLATTESKLQQLENSVEGEEKKWHDKLQTVQIDLEQAKQEVSSLQDELKKSQANTEALSELEFAYRCLEKSLTQITDEMKEKVLSLEGQLKISEDKCSQLQSQVEESEEKTRELQESVKSTSNEEDLLKQIEELKKLLSEESKKSKNLATTNVRLNGIIKTGQDSLAQEQALVDKLKSEMEKSKGSNGAAPSSEIEQLRAKLEEKEKQLEKELLAKKQLSQRLAQLGVMASSQGNDLGTSV
ncbi:ribosome-binding protein 1-like isoform X12 [Pecten maximus]|uniref:ribosome-binding protein 1-like isoform X12 n=1 Tax=Pecten maximus TaxID=6579 RepID=UPI0014586231|nr:ribosome-binding protein 1-like isoform X12 [Pecten maximus]